MKQDEDTGFLAALRREPANLFALVKLSLVATAAIVAWDTAAEMALAPVIVKAGLALLVLAYGMAVAYLVARTMASSDHWASGSTSTAAKLATRKGADFDALRRRPGEPITVSGEAEPLATEAPVFDPVAFNEAYFLMRLQEEVKDARRAGYEMCVATVHVTLPGMESTPELAEAVAYDVARIAAEQARIMSLPLALNDAEFVFSLPRTGLADTKQFVREVVRALGEYWCYFGIAAFPDHATTAQDLVEKAREACDASLQSGKRGRVEYSVA